MNFGAGRTPLQLALFVAITLLPSAIWYWHAYDVAQKYYPHHFFGAGGIRIENLSWYCNIARQTATSTLTPVLSIMGIFGVFLAPCLQRCKTADMPRSKYSALFHWWLAATLLFIVAAGYGNRHSWYRLPLVPVLAAFAGAACAFFGAKFGSRAAATALSILLATTFGSLGYAYVSPFYDSSAAQLRDAGLQLKKITSPDALIVAADTGDPTIFYYAHRKGWHFLQTGGVYDGNPDSGEQAITNLQELRRRGATHLAFTTNTFWWIHYYPGFAEYLSNTATVVAKTNNVLIYAFDPAKG